MWVRVSASPNATHCAALCCPALHPTLDSMQAPLSPDLPPTRSLAERVDASIEAGQVAIEDRLAELPQLDSRQVGLSACIVCVCVHTCMCMCVRASERVYVCACMCVLCAHVCACEHVCVCVCMRVLYVCRCARMCC